MTAVSGTGSDGHDPVDGAVDGRIVTRRQLLTAIGVAGGAGVLAGALGAIGVGSMDGDRTAPFDAPRAGDFTLQGRVNDQSVVVVGAGVSGLCCAYELAKAGYRVTVVEADDRIGGRNRTLRHGDEVVASGRAAQVCRFADDHWMNAGPARIAQHHVTLEYCRQLGVPVEVFVNVNPQTFVSTAGQSLRRRAVGADLDGYVSELLARAIARDALDDVISAEERRLLVRYLRDVGALGRSDRGFDVEPNVGVVGEIGEPSQLGTLLRLGFGERLRFERDPDQGPIMMQPVGGMDAIPRALHAHTDGDVQLGTRALAIAHDPDGVAVTVRDRKGGERVVRADHGICTLPPPLAAAITEAWSPSMANALRQPIVVATGKLGLEYRRRFWEVDDGIYGGISTCDPESRVIWYPSHGYFAAGGVLVGAYPFGSAATRFSERSHDERVGIALRAGRRLHGEVYEHDLRSSISVDWTTQELTPGGWHTWPRFGVAYDEVVAGEGRWHFAGDWLARVPGWQHGAFESARRAVTALHRAALAT